MESNLEAVSNQDMLSFEAFRKTVLEDYRTALASREVSLLGRREVLTGKAKFGIFGDGKEIAQVALAKFFQKGDFRSCLLYTSPSPRDRQKSRMPSSA